MILAKMCLMFTIYQKVVSFHLQGQEGQPQVDMLLCVAGAAVKRYPMNKLCSWWRGLTECGPLEKGMANHFSILALRTP